MVSKVTKFKEGVALSLFLPLKLKEEFLKYAEGMDKKVLDQLIETLMMGKSVQAQALAKVLKKRPEKVKKLLAVLKKLKQINVKVEGKMNNLNLKKQLKTKNGCTRKTDDS